MFAWSKPVTQPFLCEGDLGRRRLLSLLVERFKRKQDSALRPDIGEQDAIDHALTIRADLPDLTIKVPCDRVAVLRNVFHRSDDDRRVVIGKLP